MEFPAKQVVEILLTNRIVSLFLIESSIVMR